MRQAVLRKTLAGEWTEFAFPVKSRFFKVKNQSAGDVYVSFENQSDEENSFKIVSGESEIVAISFSTLARGNYYVKSVFVKGTGDVEVVALDAYITSDGQAVIEDETLIPASQDTVNELNNELEIKGAATVQNHTLIL